MMGRMGLADFVQIIAGDGGVDDNQIKMAN
jgi:hypothetical protein